MHYIDIHTHILPGLDHDGPPDMNSALDLARAMVEHGFDTVVATPHSLEGRPCPADILHCLEEFRQKLAKLRIPLRVLPGSEHAVEPGLLEMVQCGEVLTLNNTRYLLLELPPLQPLPPYFETLLFELRTRGYFPVLAHPERVDVLVKDFDLIHRLVASGILTQLTLGSLAGLYGRMIRQAALKMITRDLAHFAATDAHSPGRRLETTGKGAALLDKHKGAGTARLMLRERPARILEDLFPNRCGGDAAQNEGSVVEQRG